MIFGSIFKKGKKEPEDQEDTSAKDVQKAVSQDGETSDRRTSTGRAIKKAKVYKNNKALIGERRKKRSSRVVHTKRSFHPKVGRPAKEQVYIHDVIERPVITEKAANESEKGVYTFIVNSNSNKHRIAEAIEVLYGVKPRKVRIAKRPSKKKRVRIPGREQSFGMTTEKKKAYVFLREGDKIQLT